MTDQEKIAQAIGLLEEIHSECILADKDLRVFELLYLIGKIRGILE